MNSTPQRMPSTSYKLLLLGGLYLSQGLPFGFFTQALPVILREQQVSLEKIGFSSLLALPWLLKILWAPIVDAGPLKWLAHFGHHRSYILPLQLLSIGLLLFISSLDVDDSLFLLLAAVALTNLFAASQDVATDALAVHLLNDDDRSYGNGVQVGAYRAGMIIGGGTLLMFMTSLGWRLTFSTMAALLFIATLPVFFLRERNEKSRADSAKISGCGRRQNLERGRLSTRSAEKIPGYRRRLTSAFAQKNLGWWLLTLLLLKFGDNFVTGMVRPFLVDEGFSKTDIGWMVGVLGFSASLLGAGFGSLWFAKLNRIRGLFFFSFLQALAVTGYAFVVIFHLDSDVLTFVVVLDHFFGGMATVALFTCMMDTCSREEAGTRFTLQASVVVLGTGMGSACSGFSAGALGHQMHFVVGGLLSFLCLAAAIVGAQAYGKMTLSSPPTLSPTDDTEENP